MSHRILDWVLRVYPRGFRRRHGAELRDDVRRQRARAGSGLLAGARFWLATLPDLLRSGLRLRLARRRGLDDPGTFHPRAALPGGGELLHGLAQDLKFALRSLAATPVPSLAIVATLALAIGMNSALFSVIDTVLLQPFDYEEPEELVYLRAGKRGPDADQTGFSGGMVQRLQSGIDGFEEFAALVPLQQNLTGVDVPLQVDMGWVTPNLFRMLGAKPVLGRNFTPDEPRFHAMISHRLWQTTFGGDPDVIGRVIELDGVPYTIVGVVAPDFELHVSTRPVEVDVWKTPDAEWANGDLWNSWGPSFTILTVIGRLQSDMSIERAQEGIDAFVAGVRDEYPEYEQVGWNVTVLPLRDRVVTDVRPTLLALLGAVVFVLLIACANVANLLLARAEKRQREMSVRLALGSGRFAVVRLMLVESLVLALLGGAAGLLLAQMGTDAVARMAADDIPRLAHAGVDARVLAFTMAVSLACPLLFGLVPALRTARGDLSAALREGRASTDAGHHRLSRGLAVLQISLSLVLLIGTGLLTASLVHLQRVPTGVDPDGVLTFSISLPGTRYDWPDGTGRFFQRFEERIEALPAARSAGIIWPLPLSRSRWDGLYDGGTVEPETNTEARYVLATTGAFETIGMPLVQGRTYEESDPEQVVIVSRGLARRAWPDGSPLGRTLRADPWGRGMEEFEVVGVAPDVRHAGLREAPEEAIYFDARNWSWVDWEVDVVVRAETAPTALVEPIREALVGLDPEIPMAEARRMTAYVDDGLADSRFVLTLLGSFAGVAAVLAIIGLYGVLSFAVGERTREIGIRMALGSTEPGILRMVVGSGLRLAAVGLILGTAGALALTRLLDSFLFGITATHPTTYAGVALGMLVVAVAASYLPARRAARLDPMAVLRAE